MTVPSCISASQTESYSDFSAQFWSGLLGDIHDTMHCTGIELASNSVSLPAMYNICIWFA